MGHAIRKCCPVMKCIGIKENNRELMENAENFLSLMDTEYTDLVSLPLLREAYDLKSNKDSVLPITSDILKLSKHLSDSLKRYIDKINLFPCEENHFYLAKHTLCKIIVFNKQRSG